MKNKDWLAFLLVITFHSFLYANNPPSLPTIKKIDKIESFNKLIDHFDALKIYEDENPTFSINKDELLKKSILCFNWAINFGTLKEVEVSKFYKMRFYYDLAQDDSVIVIGNELLNSDNFVKDKRIIKVLSYLKRTYLKLNYYDEILALYPKFENIFKLHKLELTKSEYLADWDLAAVYYKLHNYKMAIVHYKHLIPTLVKNNRHVRLASNYNDIALCFKKNNQKDSALKYFEIAMSILKNKNLKYVEFPADYAPYFYNVIASNKADYYYEDGEYNKALVFYIKELEGTKRYAEPNIIISACLNISKVYLAQEKGLLAEKFIDSALNHINNRKLYSFLENAFSLKAKIASFNQNHELARRYFIKAEKLSDSLKIVNGDKNYFISSVQLDLARKESDLKLTEEKVNAEKRKRMYTIIVVLLLFVLLSILYFFYRKIKMDKVAIEHQKTLADLALDEKEILLKEVHHRVKNNLQVISSYLDLQAGKLEDTKYTELANEAQRYIKSMSLVHQMLYQNKNLSGIEIHEYLIKLSQHLNSGFILKKVNIEIESEPTIISIEKGIPIGLITTELISNSYKHAFPNSKEGKISISFTEHKSNYVYLFSDTGIGLSEDQDFKKSKTLGLRLIKMLAEEMNGELKIIKQPFQLELKFK